MSPNKEHVIDFNTTDFKTHIVNTIIKPNYIDEIHDSTKHRTMWRKRAMRFETCSKMFIGIGSITSFASGVYGYQTLSFVSGAISTLSLVLLQYANFSYKESKKATSDLNILLDNIGMGKVPELNNTTQDDNTTLTKGSQQDSQQGYTPVKSNLKKTVSFIENPGLSYLQKQAVKYEDLCYNNNFKEIKNMYEEENYALDDLVLIRTAAMKDIEMFKYFLNTKINISDNTLYYLTKGGIEFIKAFFEVYKDYDCNIINVSSSPLLGAIESNDIEAVKFIYEKYPYMTGKEIEVARDINNPEIIEFIQACEKVKLK